MDVITLFGFLALVIVGVALILFIVRLIWTLVPAAVLAVLVYLFTTSLWWAGMTFLVVAVLTVLYKMLKK